MRRKPNARKREAQRRAEIRELRAKAREIRTETVYVQTYVRRPLWQRVNTVAWLLIIGVFIGGGMIPHVEDRPYLDEEEVVEEPVAAPAAPPRPPKVPSRIGAPSSDNPIRWFSWAPHPGATSYKVEFWVDGELWYTTRTVGTTLQIPLAPGEYQWIVYPLVRGLQSKAIVNSLYRALDN